MNYMLKEVQHTTNTSVNDETTEYLNNESNCKPKWAVEEATPFDGNV